MFLSINQSHRFVQQIIEVNEPFSIVLKRHLYDVSLDFRLGFSFHSKVSLEVSKEHNEIGISDSETFLVACVGGPVLFEILEILLEFIKNVIIRQVVLLELLDNDHDKEVEHYQLDDDVEADEEEICVGSATVVCSIYTLHGVHTVKHN